MSTNRLRAGRARKQSDSARDHDPPSAGCGAKRPPDTPAANSHGDLPAIRHAPCP